MRTRTVVACSADRHRHGLIGVLRRFLRVGDGDIVGLGQSVTGCQIYLVIIGHEVEADRHVSIDGGYGIEREGADVVRAIRRNVRAECIGGVGSHL